MPKVRTGPGQTNGTLWDTSVLILGENTMDPAQRAEVYASSLNASVEELKGLPPTLIQVAENDILRDGGEANGRKLDEAGVTVTTIRYDGFSNLVYGNVHTRVHYRTLPGR